LHTLKIDTALLQMRANIRDQIARELGQRVDEIKLSGEVPVIKRLIGVSLDEI
jgi:hypothetical protein